MLCNKRKFRFYFTDLSIIVVLNLKPKCCSKKFAPDCCSNPEIGR